MKENSAGAPWKKNKKNKNKKGLFLKHWPCFSDRGGYTSNLTPKKTDDGENLLYYALIILFFISIVLVIFLIFCLSL
jgi:hypothetical protein